MKSWVLTKEPCWWNWIHCTKERRKVVFTFLAIVATLFEISGWEATKRSRHQNTMKLRATIHHSVSWTLLQKSMNSFEPYCKGPNRIFELTLALIRNPPCSNIRYSMIVKNSNWQNSKIGNSLVRSVFNKSFSQRCSQWKIWTRY